MFSAGITVVSLSEISVSDVSDMKLSSSLSLESELELRLELELELGLIACSVIVGLLGTLARASVLVEGGSS